MNPTNAVGQPLAPLDRVAHVDRQGNINERVISAILLNGGNVRRGAGVVELVPYHNSRGRSLAAPYNLVKIAKENA